jgi:hypothetical protein
MTGKYSRSIALALVLLTAITLLVSCTSSKPKPPANAGSVMLAFIGEYDEKKHVEAIDKYQSSNNPMKINRGDLISIPVKSGMKGAYIYMVADADDDPETELRLTMSSDVEYEVDVEKKEVRIATEWWYDESSWFLVDGLWAFTVCVEYESGSMEWYYVRVNFISDVESR